MKNKVLGIIITLLIILGSFLVYSYRGYGASQKTIAKKIIRFHVIANSDDKNDQKLKLKVRDEVLKYISPRLKNSKSIQQSREILKKNNKTLIEISKNVIRENGYDYGVKIMLSHENFPVKTYGNITLPQGNYEAYRIIIGKGEGHNWWCVMFPPLCFTDITKGEASYDDTEKEMKRVLNDNEYKVVNNCNLNNDDKLIIKFKIGEIIKKFIK